MRVELRQGDITAVAVDAVVNAANSRLLGGGGVDGAIHRAGGPDILRECRALRATPEYRDGLPAGQAVATTAGRLPARWVIHTVGPVHSRREDRSAVLRSCYTESLRVADGLGAGSVAFPLISAGLYRWPKPDAVAQALAALHAADTSVEQVVLVLFDAATLELAREVAAGRQPGSPPASLPAPSVQTSITDGSSSGRPPADR
ncbi:O-acetyl-ADP-ribose deacetylase [Nakamurella endophytica]|nr:O-acetyl-ADP-ribose deacetylase [Nakamurella endophytica]